MRPIALYILALSCAGCTGNTLGLGSFAQSLNERQVQGCVYYQGSYGPFIAIHGIIATGGTLYTECAKDR